MRSDPKAALRAAERGLSESRARHERSVEANALLDRAVATQTLGKSEKAPVEEAMKHLLRRSETPAGRRERRTSSATSSSTRAT